jgi:hypothetical protein
MKVYAVMLAINVNGREDHELVKIFSTRELADDYINTPGEVVVGYFHKNKMFAIHYIVEMELDT